MKRSDVNVFVLPTWLGWLFLNIFVAFQQADGGPATTSSGDASPFLSNMKHVRYLVIDEVDRIMETGHFEEVTFILRNLYRQAGDNQGYRRVVTWESAISSSLGFVVFVATAGRIQTFVCSATLAAPVRVFA